MDWEWEGWAEMGQGEGRQQGQEEATTKPSPHTTHQDIARHHNKVVQVRGNWVWVQCVSQVPIEVGPGTSGCRAGVVAVRVGNMGSRYPWMAMEVLGCTYGDGGGISCYGRVCGGLGWSVVMIL